MTRRGFTLLESAVALAIVGIVAIGALDAFAAESRTALRARQSASAAAVASEQLARLQLLDARELRSLPDSLRRGAFTASTIRYVWVASVEPVANEPGLHTVRVDVRWEGGAFALASRIFRPRPEPAR
jgi:type II secretion system protein I